VFRRACVSRLGLLEEQASGLEDWDLWVRIAELYPVLALEQAVAVWRQPAPASDQFTAHPERMHRIARQLHTKKWLRLPRSLKIDAGERRQIARAYIERATDQLIWETADRIKARRVHEAAKLAWVMFGMYPVVGSKKVLSVSKRWLMKRLNGGSGGPSLEKYCPIDNLNDSARSVNEDPFL
jgi:hypothetical protein